MGFIRQYVAPFLIFLIFAIALLAVSVRIFLPSDMMAPAPIEEPISALPAHNSAYASANITAPSLL